MAKAPIMPLFTDALIGDTTHLSAEQFGCYLLILIATWRNNGQALPDDDARMAHICRVGVQHWRRKLRPILAEFFTLADAHWHQQRLETEWERVSNSISKRQANGRRNFSKSRGTHNQKEASLPNQDSESTSNVESLNAAREDRKKGEVEKKQTRNPEGGRCAPLEGKPPALKTRIKDQLRAKHARFLMATAPPDQVAAYWTAALDPDAAVGQRIFEEVDRRMRCTGWDDMRQWRREQGIGA